MFRHEAIVPTAHASRYLQQLCKHWSHKFEVSFDPTHGTVYLPSADVVFDAQPDRLRLTLQSEDEAALPRLRDVVAEHLQRFAFREVLEVRWVESCAVALEAGCSGWA